MADNIFIGNLKKQEGQYGEYFTGSICIDDLPEEHFTTGKNGKIYLNITVSKSKEAEFGFTHSIRVNTWKPDNSQPPKKDYAPEDDITF